MFKYDIKETYKVYSFGDNENPLKILATTSNNEEELFELLKIKNQFINREIAKNINLTDNIINELLTNYIAYTMCINLAKNKIITNKTIDRLYEISDNEYKESKLREDLDIIFKKKR